MFTELLILCLLVAAVAWFVGLFVRAAREGKVDATPLVLLGAALVLVFLAGALVPLPFGGVAAQLCAVLVLAFGADVLLRVWR